MNGARLLRRHECLLIVPAGTIDVRSGGWPAAAAPSPVSRRERTDESSFFREAGATHLRLNHLWWQRDRTAIFEAEGRGYPQAPLSNVGDGV